MTEFEMAYKKYQKDMEGVARRSGLPASRVKDCVQDAASKLSQMATIQYVDQNRVKGLFCEVTRTCAADILRKEHQQHRTAEEYASEPRPKTRREKEMHISIAVHRALARLSELEAYVAWKYYAMEQSFREITEDLLRDKGIDWDASNPVKMFRFVRTVVYKKLKKELKRLGADKL